MVVPSAYECELQTLLRERDQQIFHLEAEVASLRRQLAFPSTPTTSEGITLPDSLAALVLPCVHAARSNASGHPGSSTITAALTQRATSLQQENEELYDLLRLGETGRLKEQVHGLKQVVSRLETALQESHQVISSLSTELDKSYDVFMASARSPSPRPPSPMQQPSPSRVPPTGPRAHKKQRISGSPSDPSRSSLPVGPSGRHGGSKSSSSRWSSNASRNRGDRPSRNAPSQMDVDDDSRSSWSDRWEKDASRPERERERGGKERYREKDRDNRANNSRRNGRYGGGYSRGDTSTLAERMGIS